MAKLITIAQIIISFFLFISCVPTTNESNTYYLELNKQSSSTSEKDNIIVSVREISGDNYKSFDKIYSSYEYSNKFVGNKYQPGDGDWLFIDLPAFEITITNKTGHKIKFDNYSIRLVDEFDNEYSSLSKSDLDKALNNHIEKAMSEKIFYNQEPLKRKSKLIKLIDRNFILNNGSTDKGIIAFNLNTGSDYSYHNFMMSKKYMKLVLKINSSIDNELKFNNTTDFIFFYDVRTRK